MTHLLKSLSVLSLCLLAGSQPVGATPNVNRELQLEAEESLQLVSEQHRPRERSLLDHGYVGNNEFYGTSVGGSIFFHRRPAYCGALQLEVDSFSFSVPVECDHHRHGHNHHHHGNRRRSCHWHSHSGISHCHRHGPGHLQRNR